MKNILVVMYPFLISAFIVLSVAYCGNAIEKTAETVAPTPTVSVESDVFKRGKKQLEMQGYKNIIKHSYPAFCCSKNESFIMSEGFQATDSNGEIVVGCICIGKGLRNSITVRFD